MIKLTGQTTNNTRSSWRRRIPNQLAGFAAIMLFASTQVGSPQVGDNDSNMDTLLMSDNISISSADAVLGQHRISDSLDPTTSKAASSSTKKKKSLKLNLFLFRR